MPVTGVHPGQKKVGAECRSPRPGRLRQECHSARRGTDGRGAEEGPHTSSPRPQRETTDDTLLQPTRPIALRLSPRERLVIAAELKCPPSEIGPCMLCATPIHRYGPEAQVILQGWRRGARQGSTT